MFLSQEFFSLFLLLPLFFVLFIWRWQRVRKKLDLLGEQALIGQLTSHVLSSRRLIKTALWLLAVASIIVALARPAWGVNEDIIEAEGIAVVVALDVSASMNAQDVQPSRLERAKLATRQLFLEGEGNYVGLVLFAGSAFVQFPLTLDINAALTFLNAADDDSITQQGTALDSAIRLAVDSFDARLISHALIVVMTDGEYHDGQPLSAAEIAAERGITIHTIGFGSVEGAPIPEYDVDGRLTGYKADSAGNVVLSRLDEATLMEIAAITGGTYEQASSSGIEIVNLLNEINQVEQAVLERRSQVRRVERFGLFVWLAMLMLLAEMFLPEVRQRQPL